MDLLWTTLSEFPGEGYAGSGAAAGKPEKVAALQCHTPGATWKQIPFPDKFSVSLVKLYNYSHFTTRETEAWKGVAETVAAPCCCRYRHLCAQGLSQEEWRP